MRPLNGMVLRNPVLPEGLPPTTPGPVVAGKQKARLCTSGGHLGYNIVKSHSAVRSMPPVAQ